MAKHPGGRPTKYNKQICEGFENRFTEGQSILEVAASMGVSRDTFYEWAKNHKEFSYALTRAREVSQAWWEKQGRENLVDHEEYDSETKLSTKDRFNDRLWMINISRRFKADWSEKIDIEHSGNITINIDGDDAKL